MKGIGPNAGAVQGDFALKLKILFKSKLMLAQPINFLPQSVPTIPLNVISSHIFMSFPLMMDPWELTTPRELSSDVPTSSNLIMNFEDNFIDKVGLSDSAEYLATLEKKLEKLKTKKNKKDLVKSLEERHRSCIVNLLTGIHDVDSEDVNLLLDQPVTRNHPLLRYVAPDKQALTLGELVELLKADQLSLDMEKEEVIEPPASN